MGAYRPAVAGLLAAAALAMPASDLPGAGGVRRRLDDALGARRSLLSFLPDDVTSGRFEIAFGRTSDVRTPTRARGVFWRTPSGNVYTRVDPYDAALVARALRPVAERVERAAAEAAAYEGDGDGDGDWRTFYLMGEGAYGGDEFQFALEDLVVELGVLRPPVVPFVREPGGSCDRAMDAHEDASRRAVASRQLRDGVLALDGAILWRETEPTRVAATKACRAERNESRSRDGVVIVVEASGHEVTVRASDPHQSFEFENPEIVRLTATPADVGAPPFLPRPSSGFEATSDFLLSIDQCGELPWEYSNFAAGDSYTTPQSRRYLGPTPFSFEYDCARDVSAAYQKHALELERIHG